MAQKNYTIDGKKIYATVGQLKATELKELKNYIAIGYELIDVEPKKLTEEEKAEQKKKHDENPYTKKNVEKFLKEPENKDYFEEYNKRYNEQAGTNRKEKQADGSYKKIADEPKFLKDGEPKKKGYANCIGWFTQIFKWNEETKTYDKRVDEETKTSDKKN